MFILDEILNLFLGSILAAAPGRRAPSQYHPGDRTLEDP
jgi:hypothetical protein